MEIIPVHHHVIIGTFNGDFHFAEQEGVTEITFYDHFTLRVEGQHKGVPTVTIDSNEYPTKLVIKETEHPWEK